MKKGPFKMKGWSPFTKLEDDTYVKKDQETDVKPTTVTSNRLEAINARLNKLAKTDTSSFSRSRAQKHAEEIRRGKAARDNEIKNIQAKRAT